MDREINVTDNPELQILKTGFAKLAKDTSYAYERRALPKLALNSDVDRRNKSSP
jgi:hypothetical protein